MRLSPLQRDVIRQCARECFGAQAVATRHIQLPIYQLAREQGVVL